MIRILGGVLLALGLGVGVGVGVAQEPAESDEPAPGEVTFTVTGNDTFGRRRLLSEIDPWLEDVREAPTDAGALDDAVYELERFYRSEGFPRATVSGSSAATEEGFTISLQITEGPRRLVHEVLFVGNHHFEEKHFAHTFPWDRRGLLAAGDQVFSGENLEAGLAGVRLIYRLAGYLDVEATATHSEEEVDGELQVTVAVTIVEGARYELAAVEIRGETATPHEELREATRTAPEDPYTPRLPLEIAGRVERYLAERGYYEPKVTWSSRAQGSTSLVVTLDVEEGRLARFGEVTITGNDRTAESWIRRRITIEAGELFRRSTLESTRRSLYGTGLFESVRLTASPANDTGSVLDVAIEVQEKQVLRLSFQFGFGSYELGRFGVEAYHRNLFNRGWKGRLRGKVSFKGEETEAQLVYPYLFGQKVALSLRTEYVRFEEVSFTRQEVIGAVGIEAPMTAPLVGPFTFSTGYEIRDEKILDADVDDPELTEDTRASLIYVGGNRDTRDSLLYPTTGSKTTSRVEYADEWLASDLDFVRLTGGVSRAWEIAPDWIVVAGGRAGWIHSLDSTRIPLSERFFLGGSNTVRSFLRDELGPKDSSNDPVGGEALVQGNLELRFPIWRAIRGATFYDVGSLVRDDDDFGRKDYRHGLGLGVFLKTPIGPLRLDAAANVNRHSGEDSWAIHFTFGHPF